MKLEESINSMDMSYERSLRDRMIIDGEVELIEKYISSNDSLGCVLAIGACVKHKVCTDRIKDALFNLKDSTMREFCFSISDLANAALSLLKIKDYEGDNKLVIEMIENEFDFVN